MDQSQNENLETTSKEDDDIAVLPKNKSRYIVNYLFSLFWNNIQSITSVVAILVTIILASMASQQNTKSLEIQKQLLKNQITIEQINAKQSELSARYYSLIDKIESNPAINISTVVSAYAGHVQQPHKSTLKIVTEFRDILYDSDQLAYDILSGHYNVDIALPILTGFYARIEAAIATAPKETQIIIRKGIQHYTYLQVKHAIPYLDRKLKDLELIAKELEEIEWGFGLPAYPDGNPSVSFSTKAPPVSLEEFSKRVGQELTYHGKGRHGIELAVFNGVKVISVILDKKKVVSVLYKSQISSSPGRYNIHKLAMDLHVKCLELTGEWIEFKEQNKSTGEFAQFWSNGDWIASIPAPNQTWIFEREHSRNSPHHAYIANLLRGDEEPEIVLVEDELSNN